MQQNRGHLSAYLLLGGRSLLPLRTQFFSRISHFLTLPFQFNQSLLLTRFQLTLQPLNLPLPGLYPLLDRQFPSGLCISTGPLSASNGGLSGAGSRTMGSGTGSLCAALISFSRDLWKDLDLFCFALPCQCPSSSFSCP